MKHSLNYVIIKNDFKIKEGGKYKVKFVILKIINFIIQNRNGQKLIYVAFMAVLILPTYFSNKKKKQQKAALLENLKVGDKIITVGGIKGSITNIYDQSVEMKIDKSARMEVMKSAIDRLEKK